MILYHRTRKGERILVWEKKGRLCFFLEEKTKQGRIFSCLKDLGVPSPVCIRFAEEVWQSHTSPLVLAELFEDYDWEKE